jgi:hypothetical protein
VASFVGSRGRLRFARSFFGKLSVQFLAVVSLFYVSFISLIDVIFMIESKIIN